MTDSLPAPPELDPAALAASEFARARRGLEATEVRAVLGRAADALRTWAERDARMQRRLDELEQRLDESHELDEQRIATVLGEETARIVTAARDAATEIRTKAEEQAARLISESEEQASTSAAALTGEAQSLRDDAARLRADALADAEALRSSTQEEVDRLRSEAERDAATTREEAAALATSTVSDAQARADELLGAAELVMSERTAEADAAAAVIAEAAASDLAAAESAATSLRAGADEYAAAVRAAADAAAADVVAAAELAAATTIDDAAERGREMVAEARAVRERMLRDLAEKRRATRRQLEGALAGRDRIVEVLRAAGEELSATVSGLEQADEAAAVAADAAVASVDDDLDAEIDLLRDELTVSDDDAAPAPAAAEGPAAVEPAAQVRAATSDEPVDGGSDPGVPSPVVELAAVTGDDEEPTPAQDAADELAAAPEDHDERAGEDADGEGDGGATVHDLFARIRAEGLDEPEGSSDERHDAVPSAAAIDLTAGGDEAAAAATTAVASTGVAVADPAEQLFDRRDELLVPVEKSLARVLKRLASDEQNEILDKLRRVKRGRPDPAEILPSADPAPFVDALAGEFVRAVAAGSQFWSELGDGAAIGAAESDPMVIEALEVRVTEFLSLHRAHLERAFAEADEAALDTAELGDRVRATYRDWRSGSLADLAGDLATAGFTLGERRAAGDGTPWCWVVDHGGLPCADGEDNALAGQVGCGEPFPTGDVTPPAHPGCRCILAPAPR